MLWRETPTLSASSCWVQARAVRSSRMRLWTSGAMTSRLYIACFSMSSQLVMSLTETNVRTILSRMNAYLDDFNPKFVYFANAAGDVATHVDEAIRACSGGAFPIGRELVLEELG